MTTNLEQAQSKISKRTQAREYAFKFIYNLLITNNLNENNELVLNKKHFDHAIDLFDQSYYEIDSEHPDNQIDLHSKIFGKELIIGALKNEAEYSKIITSFLTNGNLAKVDKMNLAVLLLGAFEIFHSDSTDSGIFINEYINLTKKYCPNDSHGFINSILDKMAKEYAKK